MDLGLSEYAFQSYIKKYGHQFNKKVSSTQVQKEATRVWNGVKNVIFGSGKTLHYKKFMDFDTIGGKSNTNGAKFNKETFIVDWLGLKLKCKLPKEKHKSNGFSKYDYIMESLNNDISYCDIKRRMFPNGWHYYVVIYLKGEAPKKFKIGSGEMGIDPGVSTIAGVGDNNLILKELAPNIDVYNKKIVKIQRHMDLSLKINNPNLYNKNGTVKKGSKGKFVYTKTYLKNRKKLKSLYRQKTEYIKHSHGALTNELLKTHDCFIVESMSFKSLQKKTKKTERVEKKVPIICKDGSIMMIQKYKRKKRFGKTLNNRAPSMLLKMLKEKAFRYKGIYIEVDTKEFKASQYRHDTNIYEKVPLKQRFKIIGNKKVQRDLYSAFLIKNTNSNLKKPNNKKCKEGFESFVKDQDKLISEMKAQNISMKQCFGF